MMTTEKQKRFWVSWFNYDSMGGFELDTPWWFSSSTTICAAILAVDEEAAREVVLSAYDLRPENLEWRFVNSRDDDWSPWTIPEDESRFQPADWMRWPGHNDG